MMFLQPLALLAIPCIAIPLIIHWLNHRRHKPVEWAAMHFLKRAQKVNRGMARLRYWLLLLLRMLAIAVVVLFLARPLQTGYLASWTGEPTVSLIVLDLSPSMQAMRSTVGSSAIQQAVQQLDDMRRTTGQSGQRVLFTHAKAEPLVLPDDMTIADSLSSFEQAASANIPATVQAALKWARVNVSGPVDLWICSDLRDSDWQPASQLWQSVVEEIEVMPAVRLNILASPAQSQSFNAAIQVDRVTRKQANNRAELLFDLRIRQTTGDVSQRTLPLAFEVAGVRTTIDLELTSREQFLSGIAVPIDPLLESGFGFVSLPADGNQADNRFRFVFAKPKTVQAAVVADDPAIGNVLQLALERPASDDAEVKVNVVSPTQLAQIDWPSTACVAWQTEIPTGETAARLLQVVDRGGSVIFYPPTRDGGPTAAEPFKFQWAAWREAQEGSPWQPIDWRGDSDLLRSTASGQPMPVQEWRINEYRQITGANWIPLAKLSENAPLLARVATERGGLYFMTTLPDDAYSNLVQEGITLYVLMQRVLESGLSSIGDASCLVASEELQQDWTNWKRLDESTTPIIEDQRALCSAIYGRDSKLIAINRPSSEDDPQTLDPSALQQLLEKVDYRVIEDMADSSRPLASEIWRLFACCLVICLLVEAWMTMPRATEASQPRGSRTQFTLPPTRLQENRV